MGTNILGMLKRVTWKDSGFCLGKIWSFIWGGLIIGSQRDLVCWLVKIVRLFRIIRGSFWVSLLGIWVDCCSLRFRLMIKLDSKWFKIRIILSMGLLILTRFWNRVRFWRAFLLKILPVDSNAESSISMDFWKVFVVRQLWSINIKVSLCKVGLMVLGFMIKKRKILL